VIVREPPSRRDRHREYGPLRLALGLCLVLLLLLIAAHAAIGHLSADDAQHCPICVIAHSLAPSVAAATAGILIHLQAAEPVRMEFRPIVRYWHRILLNRPPPICF
jgi:hypothetical protein